MDAAWTYAILRQFPAALKLYDRALDITPDDPDVMASKASIYQAQGDLQEAAKFLSEINRAAAFWRYLNQGHFSSDLNEITVRPFDCCKPD